ncbi:MAG: DUF6677 family protein [Planctomycetota bacterium]
MSASPPSLVCLLAGWILPGGGHFLQGRTRRGIEYFCAVTFTFAIGLAITKGACVSYDQHQFAFYFQVLTGIPAFVGLMVDGTRGGMPHDSIVAVLDLGMLFTMIAGILNLLIAFDAFDRARGGSS